MVSLTLPRIGEIRIAFRGDTIRIRKCDNIAMLKPKDFTFAERGKDKTSNLEAVLFMEIDK